MIRVRFAPSPTGYLHFGNARAAVLNWLFAQKHQGEFILRLDDTDQERSTTAYAEQIQRDLEWLRICPRLIVKQSDRLELYKKAAEHLKKVGRLYPCYETKEELEFKRKRQLSQGQPPRYDRAALKLTFEERQALEEKGLRPHWRFLLKDEPITWNDNIQGSIELHGFHLSDPVLFRSDEIPTYTLASVVDDIDLKISHIIRGQDHVTNTGVQLQLFEALGAKAEDLSFAHFSLLADSSGQGFSKRAGSLSLLSLKEQGIEPMTVFSLLAHLGTSENIRAEWDMQRLVKEFDFSQFSKASPLFDILELKKLNHALLASMPYKVACARLEAMKLPSIPPELWQLIQGNIDYLAESIEWQKIVEGEITPLPCNQEVITAAYETMPPAPWDEATWQLWVKKIQEKTAKKGKDLFLPLRLALTGKEHGPELRFLILLMGQEKVLHRLKEALGVSRDQG